LYVKYREGSHHDHGGYLVCIDVVKAQIKLILHF
jgi:hypothetical protein